MCLYDIHDLTELFVFLPLNMTVMETTPLTTMWECMTIDEFSEIFIQCSDTYLIRSIIGTVVPTVGMGGVAYVCNTNHSRLSLSTNIS